MGSPHQIAATDAPKGKGSEAVASAAHSQDIAMLNVVDAPETGKTISSETRFHTQSPLRRSAVWLDSQIGKAGGRLSSVLTDVDPDLARVLLERNPGNRKLRPSKVADFAKDMKLGNWGLNGQPIIVSTDGLLNDGQHRCAAIVEAGVTVPMLIVFGVERASRDTLDQGTSRTAGDFLAMNGREHAKHLAGAARALWQYQTYSFVSTSHQKYAPTRSEIKMTALGHPGLVKSLGFVMRPGARALRSPSLLAFCHFAFARMAGEHAANYFMDALIDGAELKRGDPILYARNRIIAERASLKLSDRVELLFRAWNAHRLGQTRVLIRLAGGELPQLED